jgi:hypothetical protein
MRASLVAQRAAARGAAHLSLAAGYAGPLFTQRVAFGPAGRRRSLEVRRTLSAPTGPDSYPPTLSVRSERT